VPTVFSLEKSMMGAKVMLEIVKTVRHSRLSFLFTTILLITHQIPSLLPLSKSTRKKFLPSRRYVFTSQSNLSAHQPLKHPISNKSPRGGMNDVESIDRHCPGECACACPGILRGKAPHKKGLKRLQDVH
jgi:hypothetical protein